MHRAQFLASPALWPALRRLAGAARQRRWIASSYFGRGSADRLPLAAGARVLTACSPLNARSRVVCPHELRSLVERQVQVFAKPKLHGKVYLFDDTAVIGSSNASDPSEWILDETAVLTTTSVVVRAVERWFETRCTEPLGLEVLDRLVKIYDDAPRNAWAPDAWAVGGLRVRGSGGRGPPRSASYPGEARRHGAGRDDTGRPRPWPPALGLALPGVLRVLSFQPTRLRRPRSVNWARPSAVETSGARGSTLQTLAWSYESKISAELPPGDWLVYA